MEPKSEPQSAPVPAALEGASVEAETPAGVEGLPAVLKFRETEVLAGLREQAMQAPFESEASHAAFGQYHRAATDIVMQLPPGADQDRLDFGVQVQMWLMRRAAGQGRVEAWTELIELHQAACGHRHLQDTADVLDAEIIKYETEALEREAHEREASEGEAER
jgi:hypothetical protein